MLILFRYRIFGTEDSLSLACGLSASAIPFRCSSFMLRQYSTLLSLLRLLLLHLFSTLLSCFRSRFGVWQGSRVIDPGNDLHLLPAEQFPHYTLHSPLIHLLLHLSLSLSRRSPATSFEFGAFSVCLSFALLLLCLLFAFFICPCLLLLSLSPSFRPVVITVAPSSLVRNAFGFGPQVRGLLFSGFDYPKPSSQKLFTALG